MTATSVNSDLIGDLVTANHILFSEGVVDGFGHVSVRHPENPEHFLIARTMAPSEVTADDILTLDFDGNTIGDERTSYLERFIHSEIYRVRPEVNAVIHSHSPSVIPFSVVETVVLKPVYHMSSFLGAGVPVFEIRDTAGDGSDMLIRNSQLGAALAEKIGSQDAVLMRGHGSTVSGQELKQTVFRAIYMEINARLQMNAMALGEVNFLTPEEANAAAGTIEAQVGRTWQLWKQKAEAGQP